MDWSNRITIRLVKMPKRIRSLRSAHVDAAAIVTVIIEGVGTLYDVQVYQGRAGDWLVHLPRGIRLEAHLAEAVRSAALKCWYDNLPAERRLLVE